MITVMPNGGFAMLFVLYPEGGAVEEALTCLFNGMEISDIVDLGERLANCERLAIPDHDSTTVAKLAEDIYSELRAFSDLQALPAADQQLTSIANELAELYRRYVGIPEGGTPRA